MGKGQLRRKKARKQLKVHCYQCDETFQFEGAIEHHNAFKHRHYTHKCHSCENLFRDLGSLQSHQETEGHN